MTGEEYEKFVIAGLDRREYAKAKKVAGQKRKREEPKLHIELLPKQEKFVFERGVDEILYGGAAGGGKSAAQCIAALIYAIEYPGSTQLLLRRTYVELESSLIKEHFKHFPPEPYYRYNSSKHVGTLYNGSEIRFGYCASENDVFQYQGAEFDVIRMDEATHFTYDQFVYLRSRVRGRFQAPRFMALSTNPGNVGHAWVKETFVDPAPPETEFVGMDGRRRIFIPAKLTENAYLMENDPGYLKSMETLPEILRQTLLEGRWDVIEGQYFTEFDPEIHVIEPFRIPDHWKKYRCMDYGLDMFAMLWFAISPDGRIYVYKEFCAPNLTIEDAAEKALEYTESGEEIAATWAPPDIIRSRSQETGKTKADLFRAAGLSLSETSNDREAGWLAVKSVLRIQSDGLPKMQIFRNCRRLIHDLPLLQIDPKHPTDCMTEPHDITHVCLAGDTMVDTPSGQRMIRDMVGTTGVVLSYDNGISCEAEYSKCFMTNPCAKVLCIELEDGRTIKCTADHLILTTNRGWVAAKNLKEGDDICDIQKDTERRKQ